jgi:hypothetical protein
MDKDPQIMALRLEASAPHDFDFIIGDWTVKHRRLNKWLAGSDAWTEFSGLSSTRKILGGYGNVEDNILEFPGGPFRAAAMRSYCSTTETWSIWWLDGRNPTQLDTPVVGRFSGERGVFHADDVLNDRPIKVRFTWLTRSAQGPQWEQAFSADGGATWETNWTMQFAPTDSEA